MTSSNQLNENLEQILQTFAEKYIANYKQTHNGLPSIEKDEEWPSPCEQGTKEEGTTELPEVFWQPAATVSYTHLTLPTIYSV